MRISLLFLLAMFAAPLFVNQAAAHCQVPCGIYDDKARFEMIREHAKTIEKAMVQISRLSAEAPINYHTIARWTATKEEHAQKIQDIASAYFLVQRVKTPASNNKKDQENYIKHTTHLHQIMVAAMKCKQTLDVNNVEKLRDLTADYEKHYFKDHEDH